MKSSNVPGLIQALFIVLTALQPAARGAGWSAMLKSADNAIIDWPLIIVSLSHFIGMKHTSNSDVAKPKP